MAKEKEIIDIINANLQSILNTKPFQLGLFAGIAELIPRVDGDDVVTYASLVDNNGNCTDVGIDDRYPFQSYFIQTGFESEADVDFGDEPLVSKQMADFTMIVLGNRRTLQLTPQVLMSAVDLAFTGALTSTQLSTLNLQGFSISDLKFKVDKQAIYREQYGLNDLYLQPEYILFSVDFTIETQVDIGCFSIC